MRLVLVWVELRYERTMNMEDWGVPGCLGDDCERDSEEWHVCTTASRCLQTKMG